MLSRSGTLVLRKGPRNEPIDRGQGCSGRAMTTIGRRSFIMPFLSVTKTGLAVGAAVGSWHALWALLVMLGIGQSFLGMRCSQATALSGSEA